MKRAWLPIVLGIVLGGLVGVGCQKTLDGDLLVATIQKGTADKHLVLKDVTCPHGRAAKAGDSFTCTATSSEGQAVTIDVTQTDAAGNVQWQLRGLILDSARLRTEVLPKVGDGIVMTCPREVSVVAVGETTVCQITKDGKTGKLSITSDDAQGNLSYKVEQ